MSLTAMKTVLCYGVGMGLLAQYIAVMYVFVPPNGLGLRTAELLEPSVLTKKATFGMA